MSEYPWRVYEPLLDLLNVRAANSARGHAEEHFAFANLGNRHRFDDNLPFSPIDTRSHQSGRLARRQLRINWRCQLTHQTKHSSIKSPSGPHRRPTTPSSTFQPLQLA